MQGSILAAAAGLAMAVYVPTSTGSTPSPAQPGGYYAHYGWGSYRSESAGFVYGRNPAGTGPAYDFQSPLSGMSAGINFGYVMPDSAQWPAWLGENLRLELALGYAVARWSGTARSPTATKLPFLDNRTPNLQISTVPANQDYFSEKLTNRIYELMLVTDYPLPHWKLTVTPFIGISHVTRRETSRLLSVDPSVGLVDMVLNERLDADYTGLRAGAALFAPFGSGWRLTLGVTQSWFKADARFSAEQSFPTYPPPPGPAVQLGETVSGKSAGRRTYLAGIGHDSGWARVDLLVERSSWSYIPAVINPILFTDPSARLDARRAEDTAVRMMFTVPIN
jgi:hypothetical protein